MIKNTAEMADAARQYLMGYTAAKNAFANKRNLNWIPYPSLCPAAAGWGRAIDDIYQEQQGHLVKWYSNTEKV